MGFGEPFLQSICMGETFGAAFPIRIDEQSPPSHVRIDLRNTHKSTLAWFPPKPPKAAQNHSNGTGLLVQVNCPEEVDLDAFSSTKVVTNCVLKLHPDSGCSRRFGVHRVIFKRLERRGSCHTPPKGQPVESLCALASTHARSQAGRDPYYRRCSDPDTRGSSMGQLGKARPVAGRCCSPRA